jgi:hypothetical protein
MTQHHRSRRSPLLLLLLGACICMAPACVGPDPVRVRAERASHALAARCADGWFRGLPFMPHDEELVRRSLDDWARRLDSDERLLGFPLGGAK